MSKYAEIKEDIIRKILAKELKQGQKISSEAELKALYNVSSTTVVKAMNELVSEGYIYRVQGKGTFVTKALRGSTIKYFENDYKFYSRSEEKSEVLSIEPVDDPEILKEFNEEVEVVAITRLKYAVDTPVQLAITYIDSRYIQGASKEQLKSIYDTVQEIAQVNLFVAPYEENLTILFPVPADISNLLDIPMQEPVMRMTRKTFTKDNQLIEYIRAYKNYHYFDITVKSV